MTTRAVDRPGDRINDKALAAAFRDSLEAAKLSGCALLIARSDSDFETFRWVNGAWECGTVARPGAGVLGYGS
jgi:hypothetical protein